MTDNTSSSPEPETPSPEPSAALTEGASPTPGSSDEPDAQAGAEVVSPEPAGPKKKKAQPVLVWLGIVCLLAGALASWRTSKRTEWFAPIAKRLDDPMIREGTALSEWTAKLREDGGPMCHAIAEMLTGETLPPVLKDRGIANLEDLCEAVDENGELHAICMEELIGSSNIIAWCLALAGIALILLDIIRERARASRRRDQAPAT